MIATHSLFSQKLTVSVVRDGSSHTMSFAKGIPQTDLTKVKASSSAIRGTTVQFKPDSTIFKTTLDFEFDKLAARIDELAYLNAGLTIKLIDRRSKKMRNKQALVKSQTEDDEGFIPVNLDETKSKFSIKAEIGEEDYHHCLEFVFAFMHIVGIAIDEEYLIFPFQQI